VHVRRGKRRQVKVKIFAFAFATSLTPHTRTWVQRSSSNPGLYMIYNKLTRDEYVQLPYPPRFFRSPKYVAISAIWFSLSLNFKPITPPMICLIFRIPRIYRGFSTHANSSSPILATLHLKTGQSFAGRSFGAPRSIYGETVFSTSITSCNEFSYLDPERNSLLTVIRYRVDDGPVLSGSDPRLHYTTHRQLRRSS
jgi:hypothetical protein